MCRARELFVIMLVVGGVSGALLGWWSRDDDEPTPATAETSAVDEPAPVERAGLQGRESSPGATTVVPTAKTQFPDDAPFRDPDRYREVLGVWALHDYRGAIELLRRFVDTSEDATERQEARFLLFAALQFAGEPDESMAYTADFLARIAKSRGPFEEAIELADRSVFAGSVRTDEGADPIDFDAMYKAIRTTLFDLKRDRAVTIPGRRPAPELGIRTNKPEPRSLFMEVYLDASGYAGKRLENATVSRELRLSTYNFVRLNDLVRTQPKGVRDDMRRFVRQNEPHGDERIQAYVSYFRRFYPDFVK